MSEGMNEPNGKLLATVKIYEREDGGLRVFSDDLPGLILSHSNANLVMEDILPAIRVIRNHLADATHKEVS